MHANISRQKSLESGRSSGCKYSEWGPPNNSILVVMLGWDKMTSWLTKGKAIEPQGSYVQWFSGHDSVTSQNFLGSGSPYHSYFVGYDHCTWCPFHDRWALVLGNWNIFLSFKGITHLKKQKSPKIHGLRRASLSSIIFPEGGNIFDLDMPKLICF